MYNLDYYNQLIDIVITYKNCNKYNLDEMEISQLDALPDKRKSPFFKMSYFEILVRLIAFIIIIYINEKEWLNPHNTQ